MGYKFVCDVCGKESDVNEISKFNFCLSVDEYLLDRPKPEGNVFSSDKEGKYDETFEACIECGKTLLEEVKELLEKKKAPSWGKGLPYAMLA